MELRRNEHHACPAGIIAVAINDNETEPHCGIVFTSYLGAVQLCDMQYELMLAVRALPPRYFWTTVKLEPADVLLVSEFIQMIIDAARMRPPPYSFVYSPHGFDATGELIDGVGLTCATFVVKIFERLSLPILEPSTWRRRPIQDKAFQARIIGYARQNHQHDLANRLEAEEPMFRIKPWEVCACATHSSRPVRFRQATKLAKTVSKLVLEMG